MTQLISGFNDLIPRGYNPTQAPIIFPARVNFTLLDDKTEPEIFKNFGGWGSIGSVFFSKVENKPSNKIIFDNFAKPLFPNNKSYPLKNEIVYIITLSSNKIEKTFKDTNYYYFQAINLWNSVHHNAIPYKTKPSDNYTKGISQPNVNKIDLGNTFKEKSNIKNLLAFEGDILYEGRWGQSIRLGSTVNNSKISNPWSTTGKNGDPIFIIRNGQHKENNESWIPQIEDINKDLSSIYLTSTQTIPINLSSTNYNSYSSPPISANKFNDNQILLNSGRLVLNSTSDSILLSGNKTINLNSNKSINLDTKQTIINSSEVSLGGKEASEPFILGNKFLDDLSKLLHTLIVFSEGLISNPVGTPEPGAPHPTIPISAPQIKEVSQNMINKIETYKSKITKSK